MRLRPLITIGTAFTIAAVGIVACRSATAPAPSANADLAAILPTTAPYITGTVVDRGDRAGQDPWILVASDPSDPMTGKSAYVDLGKDVMVVHRDGRRASVADLQPGRVVTAWVGPVERRSLPPQVSGRVLVIEP